MPVRVRVPGPLRAAVGGTTALVVEVQAQEATLADVLEAVDQAFPGFWFRVVDERGRVRGHLRILVEGRNAAESGGLRAPVEDGATVWIVAADDP